MAAVVVVKRVHFASSSVEVADIVQGHLRRAEEVRPFGKFVDLVLANLPNHPLLLAPAERPSPPALAARGRRARRRGRGIFGCRQDLHRGFYRLIELVLLLGRLLEERGGGLRPTHGKRAWDDVVEAQLRLGEPRDTSGERARHVAADRPKVERVQITFRAFPDHHHVVAHARSLESVPNRGGQPLV